MPQYLWQAAGFESASASNIIFDTQIPSLDDVADIVEAFKLYHLGTADFGPGDTIADDSIHGHIAAYETYLQQIASSAVLTISGTINQVSVSGSTGFVTIALPSSMITPGTLTVSGTLTASAGIIANDAITANSTLNISGTLTASAGIIANGAITANSTLTTNGAITANAAITAKSGINIYSNSTTRNASITAPTEGVLAYLTDTNQFTVYNGSAWVGIENHGTLSDKIDETQVLALLGL